jgi:nucleoid DNA-binding protein
LKPKKVKNLLPQLAQELELTEAEIQSVLDIYWDKVRKTLSSLEYNRVFLKGLGTFYIKPWSIDRKLKINDALITRHTENPTVSSLGYINELFKDNVKVNKVKERHLEEERLKEKIRYERYNKDLEGEGEDS